MDSCFEKKCLTCTKIIAMGSSTGGTNALISIMKELPGNLPPILIAQHMPSGFTELYANHLNTFSDVEVREAKNGDCLYYGLALVAPGNYHMRVKKNGCILTVECIQCKDSDYYCPSVDVLFESVAGVMQNNAVGVILTGMGKDGAIGLLSMRNNGARTIGQDEKSCIIYGMPKAAYDVGAVEKQASLDEIPALIIQLSENLNAHI